MTTRRLFLFNVGYWLLAALLLFADAWLRGRRHIDIAAMRFAYLVLVALLVTSAMALIYNSRGFQQSPRRMSYIALVSVLAAFLTALILNPLTYLMAGIDIHTVPVQIFSVGSLYFALLYFVWSILYLQLGQRSVFAPAAAADTEAESTPEPRARERVFQVEKLGQQRLLQDRDLCCVNASGDYVELVTAANTYLRKETLSKVGDSLDPDRFKRVHRSTIVNTDKIERVVPKPGGAYEITLEGGHVVQSSRSYKAIVERILPRG